MGAVLARFDKKGWVFLKSDPTDAIPSKPDRTGSNLSRISRTGSFFSKSNRTGSNLSRYDNTGPSSSKYNGKGSSLAKLNKKAAKKIYIPLQEGQIRLVHLHPRSTTSGQLSGAQDSIITCSLISASLSDVPKYQALSYVWGEQTTPRSILLDGNTFYVTRNLYDILDRSRFAHEKRTLWIDALSINQCNIPERNSQVQMMRSIYSHAQETLIWLHQQLEYFNDGLWRCLRENDTVSLRKFDISCMLRGFTKQAYWFRVWTAQEVRHSQQATLITRLGRAPFDILTTLQDAALTRLEASESYDASDDVALDAYLYEFQKTCLAIQPRQLRNEYHLDFDAWIDLCSLKDSFDPRDLVFGLWGCFPPEVQREIQVDYSLPPEQILHTCKKAFLNTTPRLEFLARSNFASEIAPCSLPSWDPELYFSGTWKQAWWAIRIFETFHLNQPQSPGLGEVAFRELLDDARVLHIKGQWLGNVVSAARRFPTENAYGQYLLAYFVECMERLNVQDEEIEDFARAIHGQRQDTIWFPNLVVTLKQLAKTSAEHHDLEDKMKALASGFNSPDYRRRFVSKVSTVVRLQIDTTSLFGMTWVKEAELGDRVCLVQGCSQPLILRSKATEGWGRREEYTLVGAIAFPGPGGTRQEVEDLLTATIPSEIYLS